MISIPGYEIIKQTRSENHIRRFIGRKADTGSPVAGVFFPIEDGISPAAEAVLAAYRKLTGVKSDHVIRIHDAEFANQDSITGLLLITDPLTGISLEDFRRRNELSTQRFLDMAAGLATAVNDLHKAGFIHKSLSPGKIQVDPDGGRIQVSGFGGPSYLRQPVVFTDDRPSDASGLERSELAYISPELTGRMNRPVDFRTDFYSLGVIFYELLTGSPPFVGASAKEVIHGHVAHSPAPPAECRPEIPAAISDIVMKLLEKIPEDRYQSAYGLRTDLNDCRRHLGRYGNVPGDFRPAMQDAAEVLTLSDRIFGREDVRKRLNGELDFVRRGGICILKIAGPAGIGKTSLIRLFGRDAADSGAYFCKGRFEDGQQNIPYTGILQALQDLIRQILSESTEQVDRWRQNLRSALGKNRRAAVGEGEKCKPQPHSTAPPSQSSATGVVPGV